MLLDIGTYSGNATDDRVITLTGDLSDKTPTMIIVCSNQGYDPVWWTEDMPAGYSQTFDRSAAATTGLIKSVGSGQFTIGSAAQINNNTGGCTFYYICFYDDGAGDFEVFTYTGNGADDRNLDILTSVTDPNFIYIKEYSSGQGGRLKFAAQTGDACCTGEGIGEVTNNIQAFRTNGFQVGSSAGTNQDTSDYYGFAMKNVDGAIESDTYTGDGNDNRTITLDGTAFTPQVVWMIGAVSSRPWIAQFYITGDSSFQWDGGNWLVTNRIQSRASGSFEIGSHSTINTDTEAFHFLAFTDNPYSGSPIGMKVDIDVYRAVTN